MFCQSWRRKFLLRECDVSIQAQNSSSLTDGLPRTGIPQVILPRWYDLYEYSVRAEFLGIGIYANKSVAPGVEASEFGAALINVIEPSNVYLENARRLGQICKAKCGGRTMGAKRLLEVAEGTLTLGL